MQISLTGIKPYVTYTLGKVSLFNTVTTGETQGSIRSRAVTGV